ncbi:MAG: alanine--tRNA ligase [Candidatus Methylacidiphilales bacterium]
MTSAELRQSFLDFFREKEHTIVPSSPLLPESPGLLFTNAGMNQFVPIFLNTIPCPYHPPRAADTQKCIRAGGKHNDLEDVGLDTYHHTFFEMLGNWSFGDYFKKEAINWAWELVVDRWKFPPHRLYATVYQPGAGDPAEFDQEARNAWAALFTQVGLDPNVHIVGGNKKDNFWMMGETGPCGPCSELHVDLTPEGKTQGRLVNAGDPRCIEIWNLVFIQFNAHPDGSFRPLPARHVDTGMGFERVCSIIQCTRNFTDFSKTISNYETDVFAPIFRKLEAISGHRYTSTLPANGLVGLSDQERKDIAFRVIADHIRTLSLSIADGILPGNDGRNYVLRRILRRAILWSRALGLHEPFFYELASVVAETMGETFPELRQHLTTIERVLKGEEENFNRTLDKGMEMFEAFVRSIQTPNSADQLSDADSKTVPGEVAFKLYDTYGFPLDMTELIARERGLTVDEQGFERLMREQKERSRAAQKKAVVEVNEMDEPIPESQFVGYDQREALVQIATYKISFGATSNDPVLGRLYFSPTPFYAEMGGQLGDAGYLEFNGRRLQIIDTRKAGRGIVHLTPDVDLLESLEFPLKAVVDPVRRARIEAHHSATHLLHWALREVLGPTVGQKGSYVGPDRLRFDFSQPEALSAAELAQVERLVNEKITQSIPVTWQEQPYAKVRGDPSILQFFGDKYGDVVRVVSIGTFSKELCAGTHVRNTSAIGPFRILSESAIAAGIRRIEAVAGEGLRDYLAAEFEQLQTRFTEFSQKSGSPLPWTEPDWTAPLDTVWSAHQERLRLLEKAEVNYREREKEAAKQRQAELQRRAAAAAPTLLATSVGKTLTADLGEAEPDFLPLLASELKKSFQGVGLLACRWNGRAHLLAFNFDTASLKSHPAGKLIQQLAPIVGGKGGGRPEMAQGSGSQPGSIRDVLEAAAKLFPPNA